MKSPYFPDDDTVAPSHVHDGDWTADRFYPDLQATGVPWHAQMPPRVEEGGSSIYTTGRLRSCGFCGSMHPSDLVAALAAGAKASWSDMKYGYPHKVYVDGMPNPHVGMKNSRTSSGYGCKRGEKDKSTEDYIARVGGEWVQLRSSMDDQKKDEFVKWPWHRLDVEEPTTHGKFYTVHLEDATPEERDTIERAMRYHFAFEQGRVYWWNYGTERPGITASRLA